MKNFKFEMSIVILISIFIGILPGLAHDKKEYEIFPAQLNVTDLNGKNGFTIVGVAPGDAFGSTVAMAGDVNGDGIDDVLANAPFANNQAGQIYIIFGRQEEWPADFYTANLNGANGFVINGVTAKDDGDFALSGAGDVNGDGISDILISASLENSRQGQSYVVFGSKKMPAVINLADLNGNNGFTIDNIHGSLNFGFSLSRAGDINGDGIDDIMIGNPGNRGGRVYVVFGNKGQWLAVFNVGNLDGNNGFVINNINPDDQNIGDCVSGAGDVNGDGIADILISDSQFNERQGQGLTYVVFGSKTQWPANISLSDLNGANGFVINGINPNDFSGIAVSGAGDVNEDGIDDVVIGASGANKAAGQSYVVFGNKGSWPAAFNLTNLNGNNGFILNGINQGDLSGIAVSGAGDVNGDGIDDVVIGASGANKAAGQSYVVFGNKGSWPTNFTLLSLNGKNGFAINGFSLDHSGYSVSGTGDINGDGIDDFLIGASSNPDGGRVYVIFGQRQ